MCRYWKGIVLALVLFLGTGVNAFAEAVNGQLAPNFNLADTTGKNHTLSEYKGKIVVLEWFNPDCPFVKKHYNSGNMPNLQKQYTQKGVVWLSIDSSVPGKEGNYPPQQIAELMKKMGTAATALLLDEDGKVGKMYLAKTTPHMFIIDANGILVYQGAIDSIASKDPLDIPNAKNYVQISLDEVMAGKPVSNPITKSYGCSIKY